MSLSKIRQQLLDLLPISESQLNKIIVRSPYTYKQYPVSKKTGGYRTISQPARNTKYLQYWLMKYIFTELKIHKAATAYQAGSSISKNVSYHSKNSYIAKFDFRNFFTSIKGNDIKKYLLNHVDESFSEEDLEDIVRISCIKQSGVKDFNLSIGAPISPILSNALMYEFDCRISDWCKENKIKYTRYADDLTFSTNIRGISNSIEPIVRKVLRELDYPKLQLNNKKTIHLSKRHKRRVTGLIISNEGKVSLGRSKKRMISSMIHKYTVKKLILDDVYHLQGLIAFAKDVEPSFLLRMSKKYGKSIISEILRVRKE